MSADNESSTAQSHEIYCDCDSSDAGLVGNPFGGNYAAAQVYRVAPRTCTGKETEGIRFYFRNVANTPPTGFSFNFRIGHMDPTCPTSPWIPSSNPGPGIAYPCQFSPTFYGAQIGYGYVYDDCRGGDLLVFYVFASAASGVAQICITEI